MYCSHRRRRQHSSTSSQRQFKCRLLHRSPYLLIESQSRLSVQDGRIASQGTGLGGTKQGLTDVTNPAVRRLAQVGDHGHLIASCSLSLLRTPPVVASLDVGEPRGHHRHWCSGSQLDVRKSLMKLPQMPSGGEICKGRRTMKDDA